MNPKQATPPAPLITVQDVYYILFRHKFLIGVIAGLGAIVALLVYLFYPVVYTSEAKLMIKYVVETKPLAEAGSDAQVTTLSGQQDAILNAEVDMLTSFDVAEEVAKTIGPAKILAKTTQGTNLLQAAMLVQNSLTTDPSRRGDDIRIVFSHRDPEMVEPILNGIIAAYENEHTEVRRPKTQDALQPGVDQLTAKLKEAEENLETERTNIGIVAPVEDSKRTAGERIAKTEAELDDVIVNLQAETATIKAMKKAIGAPAVVATNAPVAPAEAPPSRDVVEQYNRVCALLASLQSKEQDLLSWTTTNNRTVQENQKEITNTETQRKLLEKQNPGLLVIKTLQTASSASSAPLVLDPLSALNEETIKLDGLQARYQMLTNLLANEKARATVIEANESRLVDLEDESKQYRATVNTYRQRLGEAQLNDVLGPGSSEIKIIEKPTPPVGNIGVVKKMYQGALFGGLALALGLPFLIELYLDQSLKRPADIQSKLGVPFFVNMPKIKTTPSLKTLKGEKKVPLLPETAGDLPRPEATAPSPTPTDGPLAPWDQRHALRPFFETLRDRLMTYFEVINLTHKPKLVAVTSCREGAGVTTTAAGLASALSETGDGNVLLVNMNARDGEAHHFYRGKLTCGLEEALEKDKRNAACVQDNLFVAKDSEVNANLPRVLPKRFSNLVPKMRASDYDYIIFDMPAMSQISITPRLARYMDMILLVIESEKTDRDAAKRATNLLLESKSNVGVVLNKSREYLPRRLQQDI
ncbi:MAG TPA: hypothetical protein VH595_00575 [Verrucomicrobiae bacterium]|jgi:uncharacterized protein involved in exopolysaccharide biosynthesis/Mrp family chromosome partitioning ATPase|nr:hypothetical protein [Verrucomicrobiae bacterium]